MGKQSSVWRFSQAPAPVRSVRGKAGEVYDQLTLAWRAGAVGDFRYGTRADDDPTVVWTVDGVEYAKGDLSAVVAAVERACRARGIVGLAFGDRWCGYREMIVTYETMTVTYKFGEKVTARIDVHAAA